MSEGSVEQVLAGEATWCVVHGDCLATMRALPDCSVDALVTDPPSGISFMSRAWDKDKGGRDKWIAWLAEILREAFRVMKPGAHGFVWAIPRTSHWTGMAIEDAGFEIRDSFHHLFSTGFPKSLAADKAIDAKLGAERRILGVARGAASSETNALGAFAASYPATEPAKAWAGFGTAVKPAHEVWWLIRKPLEGTLAENLLKWGVGALNIDGCRIGFASEGDKAAAAAAQRLCHDEPGRVMKGCGETGFKNPRASVQPYLDDLHKGRFPANLVLSHAEGCRRVGGVPVVANPTWDTPNRSTVPSAFTGDEVSQVRHANGRDGEASADRRYADQGSTSFAPLPGARRGDTETVEQWECVDGCPVSELARQSGEAQNGRLNGQIPRANTGGYTGPMPGLASGVTYGDFGSAARYFPQFEWTELDDITTFVYEPKPARGEKDAGLGQFRQRSGAEATESEEGQARLESPRSGAGRRGGIRNCHPTVKGVELIRYFTRMVARPGMLVVDLFSGAGTGGVAARVEGCQWIGCELNDTDEEPFVSIARARLHHVEGREFVPRESLRAASPPKQTSLFSVEETG
jgi:hypothetical protein